MGSNDTVYIDVIVIQELEASLQVQSDPDGDEFIVPVSQMRDESTVSVEGDEGVLAIPRWLAEDREAEYRETYDG
jgi:hypothetical protein